MRRRTRGKALKTNILKTGKEKEEMLLQIAALEAIYQQLQSYMEKIHQGETVHLFTTIKCSNQSFHM